jgi:hypothetical protein
LIVRDAARQLCTIAIAGQQENSPNKYFDTRIRGKETSIHSPTDARVGTFSALKPLNAIPSIEDEPT